MKLLYCSDLHGNEGHYDRLVAVAKAQLPTVVVLGGDLLPDDSALDPQTMGRGQAESVHRQFKAFVTALRRACECKAVLVIFGNHEWVSSADEMQRLADGELLTILDHKKAVEIDGLSFLGYPYTPPTPWFVKDFERLDKPGDRLPLLGGARWDKRFSRAASHGAHLLFDGETTIANDMAEISAPANPWVFVAHAPPFGTNLDKSRSGKPWGSRAVREAIEKHQPLLSLHGHVHESPEVSGSFRQEIGATTAINAGQIDRELKYALIEIDVAAGKITEIRHGQQS